VETTVVSLGGGCDVATILGDFGVRRASLPFDWLWNLDTGLETVCDIIVDDFAHSLKPDSYGLTEHYRFPSRLSVTYSSYPSVVHMHSDPFRVPEDHATLVRRIQRFRRTLQDAPHITFVYYRCLEEGRIKRSDSTLRDEFVRLQTEGARFSEAISSTLRRGQRSRLVLVLQAARQHRGIAESLVRDANREGYRDGRRCQVTYAYTLTRDDESPRDLRIWRSQWQRVLANQCGQSRARLLVRRLRVEARELMRHRAKLGMKGSL